MDAEKRAKSTTTDGKPPAPGYERAGAPQPIDPETGQHRAYWILSEEERAKGFVRPVRRSYAHVGKKPKYPLRDLTTAEQERHEGFGYVKYEAYPESEAPVAGRFWTQKDLDGPRCGGAVTTMGIAIAETYARAPAWYGSTFCVKCKEHFPVGEHGEFVWEGTDERVGT